MFRAMIAPEQLQQIIVPGLNSETDPIDSELLKKRCLAGRNTSGICFYCPLDEAGQIQFIAKSAEQKFQLRSCQRRWRSAAEINCRWKESTIFPVPMELSQNRLTESWCLRTIEQLLVKRAIRTNPRAKGNVDVNVPDHIL